MLRRIAQVALGLYWSVCGAMMALNPPPPGFRRSASLPMIGWMVLAASLFIAVTAAFSRDPSRWLSSGRPRHARRDSEKEYASWRLALGGVLGVFAAVWCTWYGVTYGYLSMVGLGIAAAPLAVVGVTYLVQAVR